MRTLLLPALASIVAGLLLTVPTGSPAQAAPVALAVHARTLDEARLAGTLAAVDANYITLRTGDGTLTRYAAAEVIDVTLPEAAPRHVEGPRFRAWLTCGSALVGHIAGGKTDIITLDSPSLGALPVMLDHVRSLEAIPDGRAPCHDLLPENPRPERGDIVFDADGDEHRGAALDVDADGIAMELAGGRTSRVPWKMLRVMHLENPEPEAATGLRAEIELQDGSRLAPAALPVLEGEALRFALRCTPDKPLSVPIGNVRALRYTGGRFDYASKLAFTSERRSFYENSDAALLDRWHGTRVDRRPSGCPLRVQGRTFRHGFGVSSHSLVTVPLGGKYATFRTSLGIDDETLEFPGEWRGNIDARILADGKVLWEAKGITGGSPAHDIGPLDVRGAKALVLEVQFGAELMTLDYADWGDPILVKP
ncbi:MAG: NPCBM/NEW2 domain-containing protein [Planctomycetota bacterium]|nr:NPCBM/NEW2 domain-containing protein [Planctomycetota bacterium]